MDASTTEESRPKGQNFTFHLSNEQAALLERYTSRKGWAKTNVIEAALSEYFDVRGYVWPERVRVIAAKNRHIA